VGLHFHNKYIISTTQNVLEPVVSGELWTTITSTEEQSSSRREWPTTFKRLGNENRELYRGDSYNEE
jgi:hypothetical protein